MLKSLAVEMSGKEMIFFFFHDYSFNNLTLLRVSVQKRFHFSHTYRLNGKSDVGVNCPFKCLYSPRYKTAPVINFNFYLQASTHMKKR